MIKPACEALYGTEEQRKTISALDVFSSIYETGKDLGKNMIGTTGKLVYKGAKYLHESGVFEYVYVKYSRVMIYHSVSIEKRKKEKVIFT